MNRVVIIGTGLSGYLLAKEIRALSDCPITLITKNDGDYYTKPALSHLIRQNKQPSSMVMRTAQAMAQELKVEVLTGHQVIDVDIKTMKVVCDQVTVSYSKLVFAMGAEPRFPAMIHYQGKRPWVINQLEDWSVLGQHLKSGKSLAVMGAGLVGTEFAYDISGHQELDWIFSEPWPLSRFVPYHVGHWLKTQMQALGVHIKQGGVESVTHDGQYCVKVSGDAHQYEALLQAFGLKPSLSLAKKIGIRCHEGICVDRYLKTSHPHIFALGDCAEMSGMVLQYVAPIRIQAKALASTLCGQPMPVNYPAMMCVVKTPLAPVAFCVPPQQVGTWVIQSCRDSGVKALLQHEGRSIGFAVSGSYAKERVVLSRSMPDFLPPVDESSQ